MPHAHGRLMEVRKRAMQLQWLHGWRWPGAAAVLAGALSVSRIAGLSLLLAQDQQGKSALLGP